MVFGKRDGTRLFDRRADVISADLARASAQRDAPVAVDSANVRSGDADDGMLDRRLGNVFGLFDGLLDGVHRLVEIGDHALAHAARVSDSMATIAQRILVYLGDDDACLGASNVNNREQIFVLTSHFYQCFFAFFGAATLCVGAGKAVAAVSGAGSVG